LLPHLPEYKDFPKLTIKIYQDKTYEKYWGPEYNRMTFGEVLEKYELPDGAKDSLGFYLDIL